MSGLKDGSQEWVLKVGGSMIGAQGWVSMTMKISIESFKTLLKHCRFLVSSGPWQPAA